MHRTVDGPAGSFSDRGVCIAHPPDPLRCSGGFLTFAVSDRHDRTQGKNPVAMVMDTVVSLGNALDHPVRPYVVRIRKHVQYSTTMHYYVTELHNRSGKDGFCVLPTFLRQWHWIQPVEGFIGHTIYTEEENTVPTSSPSHPH